MNCILHEHCLLPWYGKILFLVNDASSWLKHETLESVSDQLHKFNFSSGLTGIEADAIML